MERTVQDSQETCPGRPRVFSVSPKGERQSQRDAGEGGGGGGRERLQRSGLSVSAGLSVRRPARGGEA